jgi:NADH-quinone oxidoreductase subunit F
VAHRDCPGKVCKALIKYYIDPDKCPGCMLCLKNCPAGAIQGSTRHIHIIDQAVCTKCGECLDICPPKVSAVVKLSGKQAQEMRSLDAPILASEWKKRRSEQAGTGAVQ